jgi:pSer/pThr/pTyr-binding forkhead associated (FHA) protein/outer membrane biosynthesis protein TonB
MDVTQGRGSQTFQLRSKNHKRNLKLVITKRRHLIGSSEVCDFVIPSKNVSAIHAVIEKTSNGYRIFDMDTEQGTYLNEKPVVAEDFKENDEIRIGDVSLVFENFDSGTMPLEILAPEVSQSPAKRNAIYPLAKDPKAEFSEYIFEDVETLYPIFHYNSSDTVLEVITTYKKQVFSVEYLKRIRNTYQITGVATKKNEVEFPYFGKDEKLPLADVTDVVPIIYPIAGFDSLVFTEEGVKKNVSAASISLKTDEIARFRQNDIEIFLRTTDAPPKVDHAPIFRRDKEFFLIFLLLLTFGAAFFTLIHFIEIDEEVEKNKIPERLARIVTKRQKLYVSKNRAIVKTKKAPKKVAQKSPNKVSKNQSKSVSKSTKSKQNTKSIVKNKVDNAKKLVDKVKKGTPTKGTPKNMKRGQKPTKRKRVSTNPRKGPLSKKSRGRVDTYKSFNFNSSLNQILAKGGSTSKSVGDITTTDADFNSTTLEAGNSENIKRAKIRTNPGSLSGITKGRLDTSRGVKGLVNKRNIYTAGLPFKRVILGGMDPDVIRQILIQHIPQFRYCYQKELDATFGRFSGIVRLDFIIGATGDVTRAQVTSASKNLPRPVSRCVVRVLKGIKFPEPPGKGVVEVKQPFNFYPTRK